MVMKPQLFVGLGAREDWGLFSKEGVRVPAREATVGETFWIDGDWTDDLSEEFGGKEHEVRRLYGMSQEALAREILNSSDPGLMEAINESDSLSLVLGQSRDPVILSTTVDVREEYLPRVGRPFATWTRFPADACHVAETSVGGKHTYEERQRLRNPTR